MPLIIILIGLEFFSVFFRLFFLHFFWSYASLLIIDIHVSIFHPQIWYFWLLLFFERLLDHPHHVGSLQWALTMSMSSQLALGLSDHGYAIIVDTVFQVVATEMDKF